MPFSHAALVAELEDDPEDLGYAPLLAVANDTAVAALLNAPRTSMPKPDSFLTERGVLKVLGGTAGDTFLAGIEAASDAIPLLARVVRILRDFAGEGLDFGDPAVQDQLDALVTGGVVTAESAAALKSYGTKLGSRAEQLWGVGTVVTAADVGAAR